MTAPLSSTLGEIGEKALLRHLYGRIPAAPGVVVGVGDDAAAVEIGPVALLTTDSLVEGAGEGRGQREALRIVVWRAT